MMLFSVFSGPVLSLAMTSSGEQCFSGGLDATIQWWNIPSSNVDPYDTYGTHYFTKWKGKGLSSRLGRVGRYEKLARQGWDVWACTEERQRIYWTKDVENEAARQEEMGPQRRFMRSVDMQRAGVAEGYTNNGEMIHCGDLLW